MFVCMRSRLGWVLALAVVSVPVWAEGAKRASKPVKADDRPASETVELFAAIEAGQVEARFIPKNSEQGRVFIKNKTQRPLSVRLPQAFAGVPVLAQFQGFPPGAAAGGNNPFFGANGPGQAFGGGATQVLGGGLNNGNQNNAGNFGVFNIPAQKTAELKAPCVCLEHGKPSPRPAIPYRLAPIESVSKDRVLHAVLAGLGEKRYSQKVAQAAAWRLANQLPWEELAVERVEHLVGLSERYFSAQEILEARELVEKLSAAEAKSEPGSDSLSQR